MNTRVGALLLAAGSSQRFGGVKLLARLPNGSTVFAQTLSRIGACMTAVLVVTRPELAESLSRSGCEVTVFEQAELGMGASLAHGMGLVQQRGWSGCLVCLADMPFVQTATYRQIVTAARCRNIVLPTYQDRPGNPVAFGNRYFAALGNLSGDTGGRTVVQQHPQRVLRLPVDDGAILMDVDIPQDLQPGAMEPSSRDA